MEKDVCRQLPPGGGGARVRLVATYMHGLEVATRSTDSYDTSKKVWGWVGIVKRSMEQVPRGKMATGTVCGLL